MDAYVEPTDILKIEQEVLVRDCAITMSLGKWTILRSLDLRAPVMWGEVNVL